jgi:hypothetical protein
MMIALSNNWLFYALNSLSMMDDFEYSLLLRFTDFGCSYWRTEISLSGDYAHMRAV